MSRSGKFLIGGFAKLTSPVIETFSDPDGTAGVYLAIFVNVLIVLFKWW